MTTEWTPQPQPPPRPPKWRWIRSALVSLLVVALLFGGVTALAMWIGRNAIGRAQVGECLGFTEGDDRPHRVLDCADATAGFTLLATKPAVRECVEVPGTSRVFSGEERSYCIGEKGVDVSKAINDIKPGECLVFSGDQPKKAACRKGSIPVLSVLRDVRKTENSDDLASMCAESGAEEVHQTYAWGISIVQSKTLGSWDRLLCLGPVNK